MVEKIWKKLAKDVLNCLKNDEKTFKKSNISPKIGKKNTLKIDWKSDENR